MIWGFSHFFRWCYRHWRYQVPAWRSFFWRQLFATMGPGTRILGKISIECPEQVEIGRDVVLNQGVYINARAKVLIGDRVHLSPYVLINAGSLDLSQTDRPHEARPVVIQHDAWITSGVVINPGVTIGAGAVVAAGAVVTRDVAPYTLVAGVPARLVRDLPRPSTSV